MGLDLSGNCSSETMYMTRDIEIDYVLFGLSLATIRLCTSGFMDDVIFARKPRLLDVAARLKRSAHAALGLAMNCAQ